MDTITIKKASASAVARRLYNLGFTKYNYTTQIGVDLVSNDYSIHVAIHTYSEDNAAKELEAAGYIIENRYHSKGIFSQRWIESFDVVGKVAA